MPTLLSPGVYVQEIDASAIVPNASANVSFLAGDFNAGPVDQPYVITNKQEYEDTFGYPSDRNYNTWFQGYKFFDYANQLIVSRAFLEAPIELNSAVDAAAQERVYTTFGPITTGISLTKEVLLYNWAPSPSGFEEVADITGLGDMGIYVYVNEEYTTDIGIGTNIYLGKNNGVPNGPYVVNGIEFNDNSNTNPWDPTHPSAIFRIKVLVDYNSESYEEPDNVALGGQVFSIVAISASGEGVSFNINEDFDYKVQLGDYLTFGTNSELCIVVNISNAVINDNDVIQIDCARTLPATTPDPLATLINSDVFLNTVGHHNAGTQAYLRGGLITDVDGYTKPASPTNASDNTMNVDGTPIISSTTSLAILDDNPNRLNYSYDLVKNPEDFDYRLEQNDASLYSFMPNMKLKFYGRNPVESDIEIAIGNWYDFQTNSKNENKAIAFETVIGASVEYTYLTPLFDYAPLKGSTSADDELAIAIRYGDVMETFLVSLDPLSIDGNGKNNYIETVINENSNICFVVDNTAVQDAPASYLVVDKDGFAPDGFTPVSGISSTVLKLIGGKNPKNDEGGIRDAYFAVEDKEKYEIDVVIGNEEFPNVAIELADARKDCIAYLGANYEDTVGKKAIDATNAILNYLKSGELTRTMFAADFANYFRIYDKFNKKYRWINCAGDMAGIRCDVTSNHDAWWVSAGMKRGIIRNINKLAFTPSQAQRDNLYKAGVNPIVSFPGTGNLVWGNKTLQPYASSFDRINTRTLFNTLERSMAKAARSSVFEFNDPYTRNAIMSMFNPYLSTIKAGRGITDYLVICDATNNTPDVISRNELRVDIFIRPNYAAEMVLLTFTNIGTRSFASVVGV